MNERENASVMDESANFGACGVEKKKDIPLADVYAGDGTPRLVPDGETVYVGVDIGKREHLAGLVSHHLLVEHKELMRCPSLQFEQSREGFHSLLTYIETYAPLARCCVVMERTGHYHRSLEQFLQEHGIQVYTIQVQERQKDRDKTDKADALRLGYMLYQQIERHIHMADKRQAVQQMAPMSDTILFLRSLVRHRYELVHECTQRKNQLTAICDELFPEFTKVFKDPNLPTALSVRQQYPTPAAIVEAPFVELRKLRRGKLPSDAKLKGLQMLAANTIGTKNSARQRGLAIEQAQLIKELILMQEHIDELDREIIATITTLREGKILMSMQVIGPIQAATLIAVIGTIENFATVGALRAYLGWAPVADQTGTTRDHVRLTPRGNRMARQTFYLIVATAIRSDNAWAQLYHRLVPLKCFWDARKKRYTGKIKVMGRVAGQMIGVIFVLLKRDQEAVRAVQPGDPLPEPMLYNPEIHRAHQEGQHPRALAQR